VTTLRDEWVYGAGSGGFAFIVENGVFNHESTKNTKDIETYFSFVFFVPSWLIFLGLGGLAV
jgi:hypothetical protein